MYCSTSRWKKYSMSVHICNVKYCVVSIGLNVRKQSLSIGMKHFLKKMGFDREWRMISAPCSRMSTTYRTCAGSWRRRATPSSHGTWPRKWPCSRKSGTKWWTWRASRTAVWGTTWRAARGCTTESASWQTGWSPSKTTSLIKTMPWKVSMTFKWKVKSSRSVIFGEFRRKVSVYILIVLYTCRYVE